MTFKELFKLIDSLYRESYDPDRDWSEVRDNESMARNWVRMYAWQHQDRPTYWMDYLESWFVGYDLTI